MENEPASSPPVPQPASGNFLRNPVVVVAAALLVAAGFYFLFLRGPARTLVPGDSRLPFGPQEQAYAGKLQFSHFAMSRAENFLNQEVTLLSGDVLNSGDRPVRAAEVTISFQDDMNQVVLREARSLLPPRAAALAPGQSAHFEISFDHVPASWNVQIPSVRVSGLQLGLNE